MESQQTVSDDNCFSHMVSNVVYNDNMYTQCHDALMEFALHKHCSSINALLAVRKKLTCGCGHANSQSRVDVLHCTRLVYCMESKRQNL